MKSPAEMSDEDLLKWAQVVLEHTSEDFSEVETRIARELASRLEAALGRRREDVKAIRYAAFHWGSEIRGDDALRERLAAQEKKG